MTVYMYSCMYRVDEGTQGGREFYGPFKYTTTHYSRQHTERCTSIDVDNKGCCETNIVLQK